MLKRNVNTCNINKGHMRTTRFTEKFINVFTRIKVKLINIVK